MMASKQIDSKEGQDLYDLIHRSLRMKKAFNKEYLEKIASYVPSELTESHSLVTTGDLPSTENEELQKKVNNLYKRINELEVVNDSLKLKVGVDEAALLEDSNDNNKDTEFKLSAEQLKMQRDMLRAELAKSLEHKKKTDQYSMEAKQHAQRFTAENEQLKESLKRVTSEKEQIEATYCKESQQQYHREQSSGSLDENRSAFERYTEDMIEKRRLHLVKEEVEREVAERMKQLQSNNEPIKLFGAEEPVELASADDQPVNIDYDENMEQAYSYALRFGKALCRELQILMVGAEYTGKSSLIASFLGEDFIEDKPATGEADSEVRRIYCNNWSRMILSDMTVHLHHQFIRQLKENALNSLPSNPDQKSTLVSFETELPTKVPLKEFPVEMPQPHPEDMQEASSYTATDDPDSINAVVWDFAGQVIFHNTHSIFISENGVPVITFNASMELTDEIIVRKGAAPPAECRTIISSIHYWLQVVNSMCSIEGSEEDHSFLLPSALLAGTHIDKLHPDIKEARRIAKNLILPQLEKELLKKPYVRHLAGIKNGIKSALEKFCFFVSNKCPDEEIDRLKDAAITVASSLRKKQPIFFLKIERSLLLLEKQVVSKSIMADVIAKSSFAISEDSPEFKAVLHYFHMKRTILHFGEIESLKDFIILSPHWLAKLFSYIITAHSYITGTELDDQWEQLTKYGILHENLLVHMLAKFSSDYPTEMHVTKKQVVDILLCFHLVVPISREVRFAELECPSIPDSGDTFIVPSLVPRGEKNIPCTEKERIVYFRFQAGFIPTSLLNQLIAECICHNVQKENQLLWMRHGKVGLKLGAHQKYYISRCEEKQGIQLTITVAGNDAESVKERSEIIKEVAAMLGRIMKVFMPAAKSPDIMIPCSKCDKLHIELKHVRGHETIYCPSDDDSPLAVGYYTDLLSAVVSPLKPDYQSLLPYFEDVSNWRQLGTHLLPRQYSSLINDIERTYQRDVAECRWALIREYLRVGEVSWDQVVYALEKSNHPNIANKIKRDVLNISDAPSNTYGCILI